MFVETGALKGAFKVRAGVNSDGKSADRRPGLADTNWVAVPYAEILSSRVPFGNRTERLSGVISIETLGIVLSETHIGLIGVAKAQGQRGALAREIT